MKTFKKAALIWIATVVILFVALILSSCGDNNTKRIESTILYNSFVPRLMIIEVKDLKTAKTYLLNDEGMLLDSYPSFEVDSIAGRK